MKVDIYKFNGNLDYLFVPAGLEIPAGAFFDQVEKISFSANIEVPNEPGGMLGIDGTAINSDIRIQGYSIHRIPKL